MENCVVCKDRDVRENINPITGESTMICDDCSDQLWEQVYEVPEDDD